MQEERKYNAMSLRSSPQQQDMPAGCARVEVLGSKTKRVNFLHKNVKLRSGKQISAQGSVYFV